MFVARAEPVRCCRPGKNSEAGGALSKAMLNAEEVKQTVVLDNEVLPMLRDLVLELEIVVDREEGLVWGLWWLGGDVLLATITPPEA